MAEITQDTVLYYFTSYTLSDDLNYTVDTVIDDVNVVLYFGYNSRLGKRWVAVETSTGAVLLERTFLDIGREIKFNINADLLGVHRATLMLFPIDPDLAGSILTWSKDYKILISGMYSYLVDDYDRSLLKAKVA